MIRSGDDSGPVTPLGILEAMLFVGDRDNRPLTAARAAELMRGVEPGEIGGLIAGTRIGVTQQSGCPYFVAEDSDGYRITLRKPFHPLREQFYGRIRQARLSQAAIDVLAIVAYQQPLSAEQIGAVRGKPSGAGALATGPPRFAADRAAARQAAGGAVLHHRSLLAALRPADLGRPAAERGTRSAIAAWKKPRNTRNTRKEGGRRNEDRRSATKLNFIFCHHLPVRSLCLFSCVSCISWFSISFCTTPEQSAADAQAIEVESETNGRRTPAALRGRSADWGWTVDWIVAAGLVLLVAVAYLQVLRFEFVNYDDTVYVPDNPQVRAGFSLGGIGWAFTTFETANWYPLTWLSLMLDCQIFGPSAGRKSCRSTPPCTPPTPSCLFVVLRRMTGARWRSAAVAALFAVHPLHVESVAWIAERKDVLEHVVLPAHALAYHRYAASPGFGRWLLVFLAWPWG